MSQYVDTNIKGFTAGGAIGEHLRVKLSSSKLALAGVGASDERLEIGQAVNAAFADGDITPVRLRSAAGTSKMVASAVIAAGVAVYGAASGKIATTISGIAIGVSLEAAAADGDIIEVLRY